jgi:hypothetical protein
MVVLIAAITFLLIVMLITIRQVRRLPLSYTIQILDKNGEKLIPLTRNLNTNITNNPL